MPLGDLLEVSRIMREQQLLVTGWRRYVKILASYHTLCDQFLPKQSIFLDWKSVSIREWKNECVVIVYAHIYLLYLITYPKNRLKRLVKDPHLARLSSTRSRAGLSNLWKVYK